VGLCGAIFVFCVLRLAFSARTSDPYGLPYPIQGFPLRFSECEVNNALREEVSELILLNHGEAIENQRQEIEKNPPSLSFSTILLIKK
jgi:hypothetical protein